MNSNNIKCNTTLNAKNSVVINQVIYFDVVANESFKCHMILTPKVLRKPKQLFAIFLQGNFSSILNLMISQTVRNECIRFIGHIDIEVSYMILQLEVLKEVPILHNSPCSQYGLF